MNVTNRQLFFMIFLYVLSFSICTVPKMMAETVGTGALLFLLVGASIFSIPAGIIAYLGYLFKNKTLFEYSVLLVGKSLTYCFTSIYMIYFFIETAILVRYTSEILKAQVLIKTPHWATGLVIILVAGYAVSKGLTNIGRIIEFLGVIIIISLAFIHILLFSVGDFLNIEPLFNISRPGKYLDSFPLFLFLFTGFEIITAIPFSKSNGKKAIWASMLSILSIGVLYIIITECCFMVLGIEETLNYNYPLINAIRSLDIPILQFLKRIDLLFFSAWLYSVFCSISVILFATTNYAGKIFSKINGNLILIITCILAFIVGLIPQTEYQVNQFALHASLYTASITTTIIPLILLITAKVKKNAKKVL